MQINSLDYSSLSFEESLRRFLDEYDPSSIATLVTLNFDTSIMPTPQHWRDDCATSYDEIFLELSSIVGDVFGYSDLQNGRLIQEIFPIHEDRKKQVGSGSILLELHTEDPALNYRAETIGLMCLRNDSEIPCLLSSPNFYSLKPKTLDILLTSKYRIFSDRPSELDYKPEFFESVILKINETGHIEFIFDPVYIDYNSMLPKEFDAFNELKELMVTSIQRLPLRRGDILFLHNSRCAHGRPKYKPRYDGSDRWLKRTQISRNISEHLHSLHRKDIIFPPAKTF